MRRDVESKLYAYNDTFLNVASYIRDADVALGNLESPFVPKEALSHKNEGGVRIFLEADKRSASALRLVFPYLLAKQQTFGIKKVFFDKWKLYKRFCTVTMTTFSFDFLSHRGFIQIWYHPKPAFILITHGVVSSIAVSIRQAYENFY